MTITMSAPPSISIPNTLPKVFQTLCRGKIALVSFPLYMETTSLERLACKVSDHVFRWTQLHTGFKGSLLNNDTNRKYLVRLL